MVEKHEQRSPDDPSLSSTDFRVSLWAAEGLLYSVMFTKAAWRRLFKQQWFEPCS